VEAVGAAVEVARLRLRFLLKGTAGLREGLAEAASDEVGRLDEPAASLASVGFDLKLTRTSWNLKFFFYCF
jgi:hypothetical protein